MTDQFTTEPSMRRMHFSLVLSWLVIVIMTVLIIVLQHRSQHQDDHIDVNDVSRVNLQLHMMSRYMIGVHQMTGSLPTAQQGGFSDQMISQIEIYADRPVDQLRIVPVIAELAGKDEALLRLEMLEQTQWGDSDIRDDIRDMKKIYVEGVESIDADTRSRLKRRHLWFAKLALSYDLDPDDPARRAAIGPSSRTVIALVLFILMIGVCSFTGFVLLIVGIVFLCNGKIKRSYVPSTAPSSYWLETVALFLIAFLLLSFIATAIEKATGTDMMDLLIWALPLVLFWPRIRGASWQQWREGLGISRGQGILREMLLGVAGQLAGLPLLFMSLIVVVILGLIFAKPTPHPVFDQMLAGGGVWSVVKVYLLACVWAPLVEEMIFRGAFYHHIRRKWHAVIAGLVSGLIFAAIHPQGLIALPALMTLAFVFAMLREWRGSIVASMTAHACNNAFVFTIFLLMLR